MSYKDVAELRLAAAHHFAALGGHAHFNYAPRRAARGAHVPDPVICMVGSLGLVEFVCGYLGGYLGLLVMSAVWRESTSDFGQFFPFVAIPR